MFGGGGGGGGLAVFIESEYLRAKMDAGLFIFFPREPDHNIYFDVLTESTVRPLTKKGPVSTIPQ